MNTLVVVDCQNDFISGSLACSHSQEALKKIVEVVNSKEYDDVRYSLDMHSKRNKSFKINGGIWPVHCVENTDGALLSNEFDKISSEQLRPSRKNMYFKGRDDDVEEYSAVNAVNEYGEALYENCSEKVTVCGIASEFCVRETCIELMKKGKGVILLSEALGFVDEKNHLRNLEDLKDMGVFIK